MSTKHTYTHTDILRENFPVSLVKSSSRVYRGVQPTESSNGTYYGSSFWRMRKLDKVGRG